MRSVVLWLALLAVLPHGGSAAGVKRRLAGQAKFTDTFSLLKKLNSNPYALNQAFSPSSVSLSQQHHAGSKSAGGDVDGLGALVGLGGTEATTAGSDAAADAVSDSIKDLFNLQDQTAPEQPKKAPKPSPPKKPAAPAVKTQPRKAPAVPKPAVPKVLAAPKPSKPKAPVKPLPAKKLPSAHVAPKPAARPVSVAVPAQKPKATVVAKPAPKVSAVPASRPSLKPKAKAPQPPRKAPPSPAIAKSHSAPTVVMEKKASAAPVAKKVKAVVAPTKKNKVTPPPPKPPLAKKAMAMVVSKTKEKVGLSQEQLSREAQLEAELSALKAKLAQQNAPVVKPVKAAPTPPIEHHSPVKPVVETAPKPVSVPVVKPKPAVKKVAAAAPQATVAGGSLAMAYVNSAMKNRATRRAEAMDLADDSDEFDGNFAAPPPRVVTPPPVAKAVPKATSAPVVKAPAVEASTAPPAVEELTMTMVPQPGAVPKVQQAILTEPVQGPPSTSMFGSFGHWFHTFFFGADPMPAPTPPTQAPAPDPNAGRPAFSKQDIERTATASHDDGLSDVAIADDFSRKEKEDIALIDHVKREDRALRIDAETPKKPAMPAPANFRHDQGSTHISNFWGSLAEEDADIERALTQDGDDLTEYERLRKLQDEKVVASVSEINGPLGEHLPLERRALRKAAAASA